MMFFFLVFVVAIAAALQYLTQQRGLQGLREDHRMSCRACEPDELFDVYVTLENHSRFFLPFVRYKEYLHQGFQVHLSSGVEENTYGGYTVSGTTWLRPHQSVTKRIPVSVPRRGRYRLAELVLYGGDFLGLNEQRRVHNVLREVIIYPKPAAGAQLQQVLGGFLGDVSANRFIFEDPVLTLGHREYSGREPMKMISWTQSARSGQLMVKKYDYTLEPSVTVLLNVQSDDPEQHALAERCFSLGRTVCARLEEQGIKYDFYMNAIPYGDSPSSLYIREGLGQRHFYGVLEQLGKAGYAPLFPARTLLERALGSAGRGHGIVFITPGDDPEVERLAHRAADAAGALLLTLKGREVASC